MPISFQLEQLVVKKSDWPALNATDRSFVQSPSKFIRKARPYLNIFYELFSRWAKIEICKHAVCTLIIKGPHRHQLLLEHHRHTNARVQMLTAAEVTCWSYGPGLCVVPRQKYKTSFGFPSSIYLIAIPQHISFPAARAGFSSPPSLTLPSLPLSSICLATAALCRENRALLASWRHHQDSFEVYTQDPGWAGGAFKSPSKLPFTYSACPSLSREISLGCTERKHCWEKILSALITRGRQVIC